VERINNIINKTIKTICRVAIFVIVTLTFVQIVSRFFGISMVWSQEIILFSFIWMIFFGATLGTANHEHYNFNMFVMKLPEKIRKRFAVFAQICIMALAVILLIYGIEYSIISLRRFSPALRLKMFWFVIPIPLSGILMIYFTLLNISKIITGKLDLYENPLDKD